RISDEMVRNGDRIQAGETHFQVLMDAITPKQDTVSATRFSASGSTPLEPPPPGPELTSAGAAILAILTKQTGNLYALLDAAVEERVPGWLRQYGEPFASLYEGQQAEELARTAPYIVALTPKSILLKKIIADGTGDNWVTWVVSGQGLPEVRKHFRHFLTVETEDGKKFFFRFYDRRILQLFLPVCTPAEIADFFGPVDSFLVEALEEPDNFLEFTKSPEGVNRKVIAIEVPA